MKTALAATFFLCAVPAAANQVDFTRAAKWHAVCVPETRMPPDENFGAEPLTLMWDRRAAVAEMNWIHDGKKFLRQLNNDAEAVVSFWFGPETTGKAAEGQNRGVDCCYNSMLTFRSTGEFAVTQHHVFYGGVTAESAEGQCTFTPLDDEAPSD